MRVGYHPVADNPIRMAYVPGWKTISDLVERLTFLEQQAAGGLVIPAVWEPFHPLCPSSRNAREYAWARGHLLSPPEFAVALALFPSGDTPSPDSIPHANLLLLTAKGEASHVVHKLMVMQALEIWHEQSPTWFAKTVQACAILGVETSVAFLNQAVWEALAPLERTIEKDAGDLTAPGGERTVPPGHGFDKELLHLDDWTKDPGTVLLPVDGLLHGLIAEALVLDLHQVKHCVGRRVARSVAWEKVTLINVFEGALTFQIAGENPLRVCGYGNPERTLETVMSFYKAATERALQAIATQVWRQPRKPLGEPHDR